MMTNINRALNFWYMKFERWKYIFLPLPKRNTVTVKYEEETIDGNYLINWTKDDHERSTI